MINITKVVSRNFILDIVASLQNIFGMNLSSYEKMVDRAIKQIKEELDNKKIKLKWYRYEITQLTGGALAVMLYGDTK
ncbi:hypothetical protein LCGC14_1532010 [marine sediment metagenome]|uniref:Uncharacterized protein n=1 Tax=marine sediment metagenome TaxID=412755 RepID=A0A0F9LBH2_9ZZZZ